LFGNGRFSALLPLIVVIQTLQKQVCALQCGYRLHIVTPLFLKEKNMIKKLSALIIGIALLLSMSGISIAAESAEVAAKAKDMVAKTKSAIKTVTAEAAKQALDSKEKAVFLDVRDAGEFAAGHLPGAMNISRGTLEFNVASKIPDTGTKIYVYCKTAGRSTLATKTLNDLGYKNAVLVDVQYADWVKADYPVER
jgi:rhodanese-related sulfurtransferase